MEEAETLLYLTVIDRQGGLTTIDTFMIIDANIKAMKLSVWAKQQGISYKSAWRMWKLGQLPMPVEQLPTGTVIVHPSASVTEGGTVLYARVSSAEQKADRDRQIARLSEFAASRHLTVSDVVKEIGSGLNGHRRAMLKILRNPASRTVVVERRDRLMRLGFEYVEAALSAQGRTVPNTFGSRCHRPKGTAQPVIIAFVADEIPPGESLLAPFE